MADELMSADELKSLLRYNKDTGEFFWVVGKNQHAIVGNQAGHLRKKDGYVQISIRKKLHMAHRLAWLYVTGCWPKEELDHIDGVRKNNKFSNLREATKFQNTCNRAKHANNTSGYKGVCRSTGSKWVAQIKSNGRVFYLGSYDTPEDASVAYDKAAKILFGEFAKLNNVHLRALGYAE